jgi:hypothetical protein
MAMSWFRAETNIGSHDKTLHLLNDPSPKRWQAAFSHVCALGWAVAHETDGAIPRVALPFVHGTPATARLLVVHRFWEETLTGWHIRNFADYQELSVVTDEKRAAQSRGGKVARCKANHGPKCGCNYEHVGGK